MTNLRAAIARQDAADRAAIRAFFWRWTPRPWHVVKQRDLLSRHPAHR